MEALENAKRSKSTFSVLVMSQLVAWIIVMDVLALLEIRLGDFSW